MHQVDARRAAAPKVQDRPRAGQRRHPREVGSARVRAPARHCTSALSAELAARGRRAGRLARVVVPVRARRARSRTTSRSATRRDGAARVRHAAAVRRGHAHRRPAAHARRPVPLQHGAHDGRRRATSPGSYDKVFLMMFGEYIPFYDRSPGSRSSSPRRRTSAAARAGVVPAAHGGGRLQAGAAHLLRGHPAVVRAPGGGKLEPNAFVNITNDAWFGRTAEPYQHLALAVFRSVEHRLEMVRAVNTGVSRPHRRRRPRAARETRIGRSGRRAAARRPPRCWSTWRCSPGGGLYRHVGDLFGFLCLAALVGSAVGARPPRRAPGPRALSGARRRGT